jgi:hypothetical protein
MTPRAQARTPSTAQKYTLRLSIVGVDTWLLIDGGVGRVVAIVGIAAMIIRMLVIGMVKKIAGPGSL